MSLILDLFRLLPERTESALLQPLRPLGFLGRAQFTPASGPFRLLGDSPSNSLQTAVTSLRSLRNVKVSDTPAGLASILLKNTSVSSSLFVCTAPSNASAAAYAFASYVFCCPLARFLPIFLPISFCSVSPVSTGEHSGGGGRYE